MDRQKDGHPYYDGRRKAPQLELGLQTFEDIDLTCLTAREADIMTDPDAPCVALHFNADRGGNNVYDSGLLESFKARLSQKDRNIVDTLLASDQRQMSMCAYFMALVADTKALEPEKGRYWTDEMFKDLKMHIHSPRA
jgi:hypothetical protein